jgi:EcoEI R protein C-terminal
LIHKSTHERDAAKQAFAEFLSGRTLTANQIEFIDLIINYLTEHGAMEPDRLYESRLRISIRSASRASSGRPKLPNCSRFSAKSEPEQPDRPATDLWLRFSETSKRLVDYGFNRGDLLIL